MAETGALPKTTEAESFTGSAIYLEEDLTEAEVWDTNDQEDFAEGGEGGRTEVSGLDASHGDVQESSPAVVLPGTLEHIQREDSPTSNLSPDVTFDTPPLSIQRGRTMSEMHSGPTRARPVRRRTSDPMAVPMSLPGSHFKLASPMLPVREEGGGEQVPDFVPPHILSYTAGDGFGSRERPAMDRYGSSASVVTGSGRTLKGRDAVKTRNAIFKQTGFL